jgi:hypothetical protein
MSGEEEESCWTLVRESLVKDAFSVAARPLEAGSRALYRDPRALLTLLTVSGNRSEEMGRQLY